MVARATESNPTGLKLEHLGVCVAVLVASGFLLTSIASAANFASSSDPATFTGEGVEGTWEFNSEAGSSECDASSSATLSEASNTLTINRINLSGCTTAGSFGSKATTMKMEGCYTLIQIRQGSKRTYRGEADLVCPAGASIRGYDNERTCVISIPAQTGIVTLEYTKSATGGYETQVTTSNITYDLIQDTPFCPLEATSTKTD
ncbi:MAG TPA: hypothetical protein VFM51_05535 [Solirubrobacterales bacterium]|nr:hypothetical protein [Solirubrobacterales bacterium]